MTDLLKASFQQACTRNPFKVLSIKPLNWSLKLFLQTVTRELLVSPFSVVSPVLHYSSSVPRRACTSASVLCSEFPVCTRAENSVVWVEMYLFIPNYTGQWSCGVFFSFDLKKKNTKNFNMWKAVVLSFITKEFLEMKWPWYKDIIRPKLAETSGDNLFSLLATVLK